MSLMEFSKRELDLIGLTDEDEMNGMMRKHILHMMEEFCDEGHSGFSARYAVSILTKLMNYEPLTPLTGADDEWNEVADGKGGTMYQNKRYSSVFKDDTGCWDINGKVFWEWQKREDGTAYKSYYSGSGCSTPVTFPYSIPEKPIYEYRYSDATPSAPPQTEAGLL